MEHKIQVILHDGTPISDYKFGVEDKIFDDYIDALDSLKEKIEARLQHILESHFTSSQTNDFIYCLKRLSREERYDLLECIKKVNYIYSN